MGGQTRKLKWSLDDLDLTKPIEPLSRLIDDPEKLIDEVFKIAAKYLPKDIVPSSLKDIPTVELKKLCLEQLKKVERETLLNILTDGSSELDEDVSQSESNLNQINELNESIASGSGQSRVTKDAEIQVEINPGAIQEKDNDDLSFEQGKKKVKRPKHESSPPGESKMTEDNSVICKNDSQNPDLDSILDQAALEIRELELRAQAIRELLKKHEDADNATQINAENSNESRKRLKTESSHDESVKVQKEIITKDKQQNTRRLTEQKSKDTEMKPTKAISRLSRNPVSMVEEDEADDLPSTIESKQKIKSADFITRDSDDKDKRGTRRKRSADESNIMIQLNNDSDDSIDRELKGE